MIKWHVITHVGYSEVLKITKLYGKKGDPREYDKKKYVTEMFV
jgi:hypothetical protein